MYVRRNADAIPQHEPGYVEWECGRNPGEHEIQVVKLEVYAQERTT